MKDGLTIDLDQYRHRTYLLHLEPDAEDPDDFVVVVYYRDPNKRENVQIVRVDTAHGYTHVDRLYLKKPTKDEVDWGLWEAVEELTREWKRYARLYDENHG